MIRKLKVILTTVFLVCIATLFVFSTGCTKTDTTDENKKYDIVMKVVCQEVNAQGNLTGPRFNEVVFSLDKNEISIEHPYNGIKCRYYVYQYNMPNHPTLSEAWPNPDTGGGHQTFTADLVYREFGFCENNATTGWQKVIEDRTICERGEYNYNFNTRLESTWNPRSCKLYITVK